MVKLATDQNQESIRNGRLKISIAEADSLPFPDGTFTCAVMTGVLGFLPDALLAFKEVFRVLASGGRFVAFAGSKLLRGTPAAPEPIASRLHFYEQDELEDLARRAGFTVVRVENPSLTSMLGKRAFVSRIWTCSRGPPGALSYSSRRKPDPGLLGHHEFLEYEFSG